MRVALLVLCAEIVLASPRSHHIYELEYAENYFIEFINKYNKQYLDEQEYLKRLEIFKSNLKTINQNKLNSDSSVHGVTMFSDLTHEEFMSTYTGLKGFGGKNCQLKAGEINNTSVADSCDWREKNAVTKVKDQERCGSCWAFGATGNLEGQYAIKHKELLEFSEQQLVDCDHQSQGCDGTQDIGYPFQYWEEKGAILGKDYPYHGQDEQCKYDASKVKVKLSGCTRFQAKDEEALKAILHETGPLTIGIDASSLMDYQNGVLNDCPSDTLNHAVLLVGYGTDGQTPYWLIKNSWGTKFGEDGYVRVKRGVNSCGLMNENPVSAVLA